MADQDPIFQIQRVYLKEASLEQPNSPAILLEQEQPSVDIQLGVEANPVADGVYEICVTATVQTKIKDKTVFLVEAKQAGIFEIRHLPQDQMGPIMGIACPQIVYPYLRGNGVELTDRVKSGLSEKGIDLKSAEAPPGEHQIRIAIQDSEGRQTSAVLTVNVVK